MYPTETPFPLKEDNLIEAEELRNISSYKEIYKSERVIDQLINR